MKSILGQLLNGRYFVVRQLQHTPSHITYLADDQHKLDRSQCLVKQYKIHIPTEVNTVKAKTKFKSFLFKEIDKIRQFDCHPQIPQILDYFFWGEELYVIREFIRGETVEEEISHRTLEEAEVLHLLQETLPILDAIHQAKQMHLNLKPSNIIFAAGSEQIFLADSDRLEYSLKNRIVKSEVLEATSIRDDYYLAPEQKSGKPQVSSDFYALGTIAIQALTGKYPHEVRLCNLDNYARASLVDLETSKTVNISSQLGKILHDLTNRNPASRYQSAQDILKSLAQSKNVVVFPSPSTILPKENISKKSFSSTKKTKKSSKKNKVLPFIISSFLLSGLLVVTLKLFFDSNSNSQPINFLEYQNSNYNIAIKYPQEWTIKELEDPITGEIIAIESPLENESDSFREKIYLSIDTISTTPEEYKSTIIENIKKISGSKNIKYQKESQKFDNQPTYSITYQRTQGKLSLQQKEVFIFKDSNVYSIAYIAEKERYQDRLKTVNQIIKTFTSVEQ